MSAAARQARWDEDTVPGHRHPAPARTAVIDMGDLIRGLAAILVGGFGSILLVLLVVRCLLVFTA